MHFFVRLHCLHWSHAMTFEGSPFYFHVLPLLWYFLLFNVVGFLSFFSVKPDILALKHYFLSFGIFSLQKCTLSFSCWRYCATFEMMEIWKFSIQSYKSNFTLTLRNIQRGVSHMRGRYILWHWLVLYMHVRRSLSLKITCCSRRLNCARLTITVL